MHELTVRSTEGFHHSKVGYFEINVLIEEAVLKLQVTMGDVLAVDESRNPVVQVPNIKDLRNKW